MLRRFNYTGRKKIPRSRVSVKVSPESDGVTAFDAKFDVTSLELPGHAKVYVEAYHRASYMRFDFGELSAIRSPENRRLTDIEGGGTAQFRLKIVDETAEHGKVLAEADGITPFTADDEEANRKSILPVVLTDLGQEIWRVQFDNDRPVLELNKTVEGIGQLAVSDDYFLSLAYPAVIRLILGFVFRDKELAIHDGPSDDWRVQWIKFAYAIPGVPTPPQFSEDEDEQDWNDRRDEWIDGVVSAFCIHHKSLERFNRAHLSGASS